MLTIIISVLLFIIGFIIGYSYKTTLYQKQKLIPNIPIYQPKYMHFDIPEDISIEQLKEELRCVRLEISIHPLETIKTAKFSSYKDFEKLQKEYKELKLKELSLIEAINKINF